MIRFDDGKNCSGRRNIMNNTVHDLHTIEELEKALLESTDRPVLIFKHSLTCPISSRAFYEFQAYLEAADSQVAYKLITVQTDRQVSTAAAERLGVTHQSPQAILVTNCRSVWDASHYDITSESIDQAIREFTQRLRTEEPDLSLPSAGL